MNNTEFNGKNSFAELVTRVYWEIIPEYELLLKTALYQTVQIYDGIEKFAIKCNIPFDEFFESINNDCLNMKIFHKIFPYIIPQLKWVFDQYIENEAKKELREILRKNGIDSNEDFASVINKTIMDFELSERRKKYDKIAQE